MNSTEDLDNTFDAYMDSDNFTSTISGEICDKTLGTTLVLCTLVGVSGNSLALGYFSSQLKNKRDLPTLLYVLICSIDICTCLAHLPVAGALFTSRSPGLFDSMVVCSVWKITNDVLLRVSMFLVMLLSVCRTFSIVLPFYEIRSRIVICAFFLYSFIIISKDTFVIPVLFEVDYIYYSDGPFCYTEGVLSVVFSVLEILEFGIPPLVTFVSFVICSFKLLRSSNAVASDASQEHNRRASTTIAMFTALFLICNLPYFVNNLMENLTYILDEYPGPIFSNTFMFWYSWPISKILFTVLNASLNPVLYYCRMSGFREWIYNLPLVDCFQRKEIVLSELGAYE